MNIEITKDELILKLPLKQNIYNHYVGDESLGKTDNLIGIIAGREYTISQLIDLDYKDAQQEGVPIIHFDTKEELEKVCKEADVQIWEHTVCAYCDKAIRGEF